MFAYALFILQLFGVDTVEYMLLLLFIITAWQQVHAILFICICMSFAFICNQSRL